MYSWLSFVQKKGEDYIRAFACGHREDLWKDTDTTSNTRCLCAGKWSLGDKATGFHFMFLLYLLNSHHVTILSIQKVCLYSSKSEL